MIKLILSTSFLFASFVYNETTDPAAGVAVGYIAAIDVGDKGDIVRIFMKQKENVINPEQCGKSVYYVIEMDENKELMMKLLTTAHVANRKVRFYVRGCTAKKWWNATHPIIRYARML